jgi:hypothetical protein
MIRLVITLDALVKHDEEDSRSKTANECNDSGEPEKKRGKKEVWYVQSLE